MMELNDEIRELFQQKIADLLTVGETSNAVRNSTKIKEIYSIDEYGERILIGEHHDKEETKLVNLKGTPRWVLDEIAKSMSIETAIKLLTSQGYLVIDPTNKPQNKEKTSTLSDLTVNQLKSRILGLNRKNGTN